MKDTNLKPKGKAENQNQNQSLSRFKIRNKASSVAKMYIEQTKEIKNCLNKIGIINSQMKVLKI